VPPIYPEGGRRMSLRNIGVHGSHYTLSWSKQQYAYLNLCNALIPADSLCGRHQMMTYMKLNARRRFGPCVTWRCVARL